MQELVQIRFGRRELRTGRIRFTAAELINALEIRSDEKAIIEGAVHDKSPLNPVSLGRWLKNRLVDAPINGLVLRSAMGRTKCAEFWATKSGG